MSHAHIDTQHARTQQDHDGRRRHLLDELLILKRLTLARAHSEADETSTGRHVPAASKPVALELSKLHELGVRSESIQWLTTEGYVAPVEPHATESAKNSKASSTVAEFAKNSVASAVAKSAKNSVASPRNAKSASNSTAEVTHIQLTETGFEYAEYILDLLATVGNAARPTWNPETRKLRLGPTLIKQFRRRAENQERILATFEELNWPERIDDPLPPTGDVDPVERLKGAVKRLNSSHKTSGILRFERDGTGEGVIWRRM